MARFLNRQRLRTAARLIARGEWRILAERTAAVLRGEAVEGPAPEVVLAGNPADPLYRQEPWPEGVPLVSVVIPCFNYGEFIVETVDSVLAQTFRDIEVIVVEGGSTDAATRAVVAGLRRPRLRVLMRDGPRLVGDNRNHGIAAARGRYVCCIDADDKLKPTYLESAAYLLENLGYDMVSTAIRFFGNRDGRIGIVREPDLADMVEGNHVTTCAVFRRSLWAAAGGFRDTGRGREHLYEDWRLWMRFAALGARIYNIAEPLFLYRSHDRSSLSNADGVPPPEAQRGAIAEANRDVLTPEAFARSRALRRARRQAANPSVNLGRGLPPLPPGRWTILLALPFLVVGGAERLLSTLVRHFTGEGHRVVVITTIDAPASYGDSSGWFEAAGAEIFRLPSFLGPEHWRGFIEYLVERRQVDVAWVAGSAVMQALLPELKRLRPGLRTVDLLFNTSAHFAANRRFRDAIDLTLTDNDEVLRALGAAGEAPDRMRVIHTGVDLAHYRPVAHEGGPFVAGFSGRLSDEKRPGAFLDIAAACRDDHGLRFVMTGAGPMEDLIRGRIAREELAGRLHFAGSVEDVRDHLGRYDALVVPSAIEGRPFIVLEGLAMGVPVIASRVGGLPELVEDGVTGFLCPADDVAAFTERIRWLRDHPAEHAAMRARARAYAERHLDVAQMNRAYGAAIRALVAAPA